MNQKRLSTEDIVNDTKASPEARGERLKRLRNLANLSRKEICEEIPLNIETLKGWELGKHGGLTAKGAEKVIQRLTKEGVYCTLDWLLYESGSAPEVITDFSKIRTHLSNLESFQPDSLPFEEERFMVEELCIFRHHYHNTIDFIVNDDSMLPLYRVGDYVAGIQRYSGDIEKVLEENCIVQLEEGIVLLRRLSRGSKEAHYHLFCINSDTILTQPTLYDVKLISAAPVIWQRRKHFAS